MLGVIVALLGRAQVAGGVGLVEGLCGSQRSAVGAVLRDRLRGFGIGQHVVVHGGAGPVRFALDHPDELARIGVRRVAHLGVGVEQAELPALVHLVRLLVGHTVVFAALLQGIAGHREIDLGQHRLHGSLRHAAVGARPGGVLHQFLGLCEVRDDHFVDRLLGRQGQLRLRQVGGGLRLQGHGAVEPHEVEVVVCAEEVGFAQQLVAGVLGDLHVLGRLDAGDYAVAVLDGEIGGLPEVLDVGALLGDGEVERLREVEAARGARADAVAGQVVQEDEVLRAHLDVAVEDVVHEGVEAVHAGGDLVFRLEVVFRRKEGLGRLLEERVARRQRRRRGERPADVQYLSFHRDSVVRR